MTKNHPIARTVLAAGLALAGTLISFAATTSNAYAGGAERYHAQLANALAAPKSKIINDVLWSCAGNSCTAEVDGSRAIYTCIKVAKAFGPVAAFNGPKGDFSATEVAQCNSGKA